MIYLNLTYVGIIKLYEALILVMIYLIYLIGELLYKSTRRWIYDKNDNIFIYQIVLFVSPAIRVEIKKMKGTYIHIENKKSFVTLNREKQKAALNEDDPRNEILISEEYRVEVEVQEDTIRLMPPSESELIQDITSDEGIFYYFYYCY